MNILALDPAAHTGFAHSNGQHGVWDLSQKFDRDGDRLVRLESHLETAIKDWGCDLLAAEDATFGAQRNPHTQSMHNELRGVIRLVGARHGIDVRLFNPSTIKSFATGSGRAKKDQMVRACKLHYGLDVTHDEADAIFICKLAKRPDCWTQSKTEKKAVKKRTAAKQPKLFR